MKFNIEDYSGEYVMHCKTKEEARSFCDYLEGENRRWSSGTPYKDTNWEQYDRYTAYNFNMGTYCDVEHYKLNGYTILEWEDFMKNTFTKANLKTGDIIKRRNGYVEIVILEHDACVSKSGFNWLSEIEKDLTSHSSKEWDVVAVHRPKGANGCRFDVFERSSCNLVYEREEAEEMTLAQVCKLLGKNIKIVKE